MKNTKQYKSDAFAAIHETMDSLNQVDAISKQTMKDFDKMCLESLPDMAPEAIRSLRKKQKVSQPIFALYLNVSRNLVSDWERGVKKPGGPALRLLSIVEKNGLNALVN